MTRASQTGRVAVRMACWTVFAAMIIWLCFTLKLRFPEHKSVELLAAKLAFLAIGGAIAAFQYGVWQNLAERLSQEIDNPSWLLAEAAVERDRLLPEQSKPADLPQRIAAVAMWHSWRAERLRLMLSDILPHNRITLANYLIGAYLLLVSSLVDLVFTAVGIRTRLEGALSTGTLIASIVPFIENWVRYVLSVTYEFSNWERRFKDAAQRGGGV